MKKIFTLAVFLGLFLLGGNAFAAPSHGGHGGGPHHAGVSMGHHGAPHGGMHANPHHGPHHGPRPVHHGGFVSVGVPRHHFYVGARIAPRMRYDYCFDPYYYDPYYCPAPYYYAPRPVITPGVGVYVGL